MNGSSETDRLCAFRTDPEGTMRRRGTYFSYGKSQVPVVLFIFTHQEIEAW